MRRTRLPLFASLALLCPALLAASDGGGFSMTLLVDGAPAAEYGVRGRVYVEALRGREFTIRLYNPGPDRVAAALSVDGRNVVDAKRTSAQDAVKWILAPGQSIEIPGWQISGQTSRRFFFTETSRSYARWLGETTNVGIIEAVFFREKRPPVIAGRLAPKDEPQARGRDSVGDSGVEGGVQGEVPRSPGSAPPSSAQAAPPARRESDRFAATGIGERTDFPVAWVEFDEEDRPAARVALRYEFHDELVRLGVLPRLRDGELGTRERGRGFSPEYAPDPAGRR